MPLSVVDEGVAGAPPFMGGAPRLVPTGAVFRDPLGGAAGQPELCLLWDGTVGTDGVVVASTDPIVAGFTQFSAVTENTGSGGSFKRFTSAAGHRLIRMSTGVTAVSCFGENGTGQVTGSGLTLCYRFAAASTANPAAALDVMQPRDSATRFRLRWNATGTLSVVNGSTVVATTTATVPLTGQLWRAEWRSFADAATGELELRFWQDATSTAAPDEVVVATGLNTGTTEVTNVRSGNPFATASMGPIDFGYVGVSNMGWIGPVPAVPATGIAEGGTTAAAAASTAAQVLRVLPAGSTPAAATSTAVVVRRAVQGGVTSAAATSVATRASTAIVGRGVTVAAVSGTAAAVRRALAAASSPAAAAGTAVARRVVVGKGTAVAAATSTAVDRRVVVGRGSTPAAGTSTAVGVRRILGSGVTGAAAASTAVSVRRAVSSGVAVAAVVGYASRSLARAQAGVTAAAVTSLASSARRALSGGVTGAAATSTAVPRRTVLGRGTTAAAAASSSSHRRVIVGRGTAAAALASRSTAVRRALVAARAVAAVVSTVLRPVTVVTGATMHADHVDVAHMSGQVSDTGSGAVAHVVEDAAVMTTSEGARVRAGDLPGASMTEG